SSRQRPTQTFRRLPYLNNQPFWIRLRRATLKPPCGGPPCLLVKEWSPEVRSSSTTAGKSAGFGAFGVDVRLQVAAVETQVLSEFDERKALLGTGPHVFVHPRDGDSQKTGGVMDRQERVVVGEV